MRSSLRWMALGLAALLGVTCPGPMTCAATDDATDWQLETVKLKDGRELRGFIEPVNETQLELIEVNSLPSKRTSLVVIPLERSAIERWRYLPEAEHESLREKIHSLRSRAAIATQLQADILLTGVLKEGQFCWQYHGPWFSLESTTDEAATRQIVIRMEQSFAAYRQCFPPQADLLRPRLTILLFGRWRQYQDYLGQLGLDLKTPAFFVANLNVVVAGSDINQYAHELSAARENHRRLDEQMKQLRDQIAGQKQQLVAELAAKGMSEEEQQEIVQLDQQRWEEQVSLYERKIEIVNRRNAERFATVSNRLTSRLAHEAFHAYLENCVYPSSRYEVPRWLNEGLAQLFETGQLDGERFRIDLPQPELLVRLQHDLRTDHPLSLEKVLNSDPALFLADHRQSSDEVARQYLYCWGLAYYFMFDKEGLGTPACHDYLAATGSKASRVARFERWVGMPWQQFEAIWHSAMLDLRPGYAPE